ncbi:MAG: alkaline phosphatase D family protein [Rubrivivax sp.]
MRRRQCLATAALVAMPALLHHARAADVPRFALGVASGHPRPDRVVLWTRVTGHELPDTVPVQWELAHDEGFTRIAARGSETAEAAWAHSVHAEPAGLDPGRGYWYRFQALGQRSRVGRTRTAPALDAEATLRLSIASCQRWDHGAYGAWRALAADPPDLVAFLGDYIYEYPSSPLAARRHEGGLVRTLDQYRARYAQYKSDPALQDAHAACPWIVTWDDHEVENDYAGTHPTTPLGADMAAIRAAAYQAAWEHQPFPQALRPRGMDMRVVARFDWGRLARLHVLDARQYRDVQACPTPLRSSGSRVVHPRDCAALQDPARTLLGPEQERWLAEGWDLQRPWNLLLQQTLMARFTGPDGSTWTDGWDGYPAARTRLLRTVAERRVGGVVVLGGDVHAHHVADLHADADDPRSPVVASEFCGSSISSRGRSQGAVDAARAVHPHMHLARADQRGTIDFAIGPRQLQARVKVVERPQDADSPVSDSARFVVDPARPGPQRA